jgi:hypothetical protein
LAAQAEEDQRQALDDKRQALSSALSLGRLLLSVAAGTIVLSGTLLQTIYVGRSLHLLEAAWVLLGVSLVFGYLVHGRYIAQLDESNLDSTGAFEWLSLLQSLFIAAGLTLFAIFVAINLDSGPRLEATRTELGVGARYVVATVDCRSGADSGCRGEVVLGLAGKRPREIGRTLFAAKADGPLRARVPLSRAEGKFLATGKARILEVHALATGRFGNQTEVTVELRLRRPPASHGENGPVSSTQAAKRTQSTAVLVKNAALFNRFS